MHPLLTGFLSTLCFPFYLAQGIAVRQRALRLSPAPGARSGVEGKGKGGIHLLTVGDSSAAAVGCEATSEAMAPQLAAKLAQKTGQTVRWRMSGHNSAVAGEIRDIVVPNLERDSYTHILVMVGTNDIKNWHTTRRWKREFGGLIYALRTRFPEARLYWCQALDMNTVPALPQPLAAILNMRRDLLNRKGAQLCVERDAICIPPLPVEDPAGFCRDGFHANAAGFNYWAEHIVKFWDCEPRTTPAANAFL